MIFSKGNRSNTMCSSFLSILERVRRSSTIVLSLFDCWRIISRNFLVSLLCSKSSEERVSIKPLIDVIGVFNS